ncbi:hypothetical protein B0J14DRAFT_663827 [Halenospora varia]|nr:hypothetical protein B0J14DRAFT_663827 [Halenospora varia]
MALETHGLCVLLVSVIVIAVALSKSLKNGSSTPPNSTATTTAASSPTPTTGLKCIRTNSSIAATWFRSGEDGNGYGIRLCYQDSDDFIRESAIDSQSGTWKVTDLPVKAKPQSPLAAWSVPDSGTFVGGYSVFYLDDSSMLWEYWFDHHGQNRSGTLSSQAVFAEASSALSAHYGLAGSGIIYQGIARNLHLITDTIKGTPSLLINITGAALGTSLSLISYVKREGAKPVWTLFYQGKHQLLRSVTTNDTSPWAAADTLSCFPRRRHSLPSPTVPTIRGGLISI